MSPLFGIRAALGLAALVAVTATYAHDTIKVTLTVPMSGPFANIGDLYVKNN